MLVQPEPAWPVGALSVLADSVFQLPQEGLLPEGRAGRLPTCGRGGSERMNEQSWVPSRLRCFPAAPHRDGGVQVWQRVGLSDDTRRDDMQASQVAAPSWSLPLAWALPGSSFQVQLEGGLGLCHEFPSIIPSALALQSGGCICVYWGSAGFPYAVPSS